MAKQEEDIKQNIIIEVKESGVDETTKDITNLNKTIDSTTEAQKKNTAEVKKAEASSKSFKAQLREANAELIKTVQTYGATSKEAVKAAKGVADLKDEMAEAKDLAEAFNPDQKFKALGAASQLAATGVSAVTSGFALFGDQSKDTEKTLLKVQAAMAFSDSISQLSELGDQWNLLKTTITSSGTAQKIYSVATAGAAAVTKLFGKTVDESSTSFKTLRGAIIGTGIGALVVGVGLLINNFDTVKKVVLNFIPGLAKVGEGIMNIVQAVTDFVGITSESERAVDKMKANAEASIAMNKRFLDENGSQLDEFTKQKIAAVDDYHKLIQEDGANQVALKKELNRKLAQADQDREDQIQKKRDEAAKKAKDAQDKIDAAAKAKRDKEAAEAKAKRDKAEADLQAAKDAARKATEALLADVNKAIDDATEKNIEGSLSAQEVEIRNIKDAYFQKIELAKQFGKDTAELETAQANDLNEVNLKYQNERYAADKESADKKIAVDKEVADAKRAIQESEFNVASQGIALVASLFGKNKAIQKAALIAESAIGIAKVVTSTQAANAATTAKYALLPGGEVLASTEITLNNVSAGIGIAANVAATAKALSAVGGGSAPSAGGTTSAPTRNVAQVGFQASPANQIASSIAKNTNEQGPIKAIVVSSDITTAQQFDKIKELGNKI